MASWPLGIEDAKALAPHEGFQRRIAATAPCLQPHRRQHVREECLLLGNDADVGEDDQRPRPRRETAPAGRSPCGSEAPRHEHLGDEALAAARGGAVDEVASRRAFPQGCCLPRIKLPRQQRIRNTVQLHNSPCLKQPPAANQ